MPERGAAKRRAPESMDSAKSGWRAGAARAPAVLANSAQRTTHKNFSAFAGALAALAKTGWRPACRLLSTGRGGAGFACLREAAGRSSWVGCALGGPELLACGVYPYRRLCARQKRMFCEDCFS